jgi:hypothetical protein
VTHHSVDPSPMLTGTPPTPRLPPTPYGRGGGLGGPSHNLVSPTTMAEESHSRPPWGARTAERRKGRHRHNGAPPEWTTRCEGRGEERDGRAPPPPSRNVHRLYRWRTLVAARRERGERATTATRVRGLPKVAPGE